MQLIDTQFQKETNMSDNTIASLLAEAEILQSLATPGENRDSSFGEDGNGFAFAGSSSNTGYQTAITTPDDGLITINGIEMHRSEAEALGLRGKPEASAKEAQPKANITNMPNAEPAAETSEKSQDASPELTQEIIDGAQFELMTADNKLDNVQAGLNAVASGAADASDLIAQAVDAGVEMGDFIAYHTHQANSMLKAAGISMTAEQISSVPGLSDAVTSAYLAGDTGRMASLVKAYQSAHTA